MNNSLKFTGYLLVLLYFGNTAFSQNSIIPEPTGKVISDFENLLSEKETQEIATLIKKAYSSSSNQLVIACVPTKFTGDLTIEEYANQFFKKWKPGQKDLNNGILMIISGSKLDSIGRKVRFEVGYGVEGALPDILCKKIQRDVMVPLLSEHRYAEAIRNGSLAILEAIKNENVGHSIVFKSDPHAGIVLKDETGLLTSEQFSSMEERLKKFSTAPSVIIFGDQDWSDVAYMGFSMDDQLFELSVNPGITFSVDSTNAGIEQKKMQYYLRMSNDVGFTEEEKEANRIAVNSILDRGDFVGGIEKVIELRETGLQRCWGYVRTGFWIQLAVFFSCFAIWVLRKRKVWTKENVKGFRKFIVVIVNAPVILISILALIGWIVIYIAVYSGAFKLPANMLVFSCIAQELTGVFTIIIAGGNLGKLIPAFSSGSGANYSGGSYTYSSSGNSSDYSSSSSSDYTSSSSSSDSNSDYGGGGGDSGGGGASSDW